MDVIIRAIDSAGLEMDPVMPLRSCRVESCETRLQIGIFFDGTQNNRESDEGVRKDTNVARLFRAYPNQPELCQYRVYVPGVGTTFNPVGENKPSSIGSAFGAGGEARIIYGLLNCLSATHQAVANEQVLFDEEVVLALCRNGPLTRNQAFDPTGNYSRNVSAGDEAALDAVGMKESGGLVTVGRSSNRTTFLRRHAQLLAEKIRLTEKPRIIEIFIDVFGFSRGAAQARVFCTWLDELFDGPRFCGVPAQIRFLGLFDTVASVGVPVPVGGTGHMAWATAANMRVPARVRNCLHLVAMHENRESFPLEQVRVGDHLPPNCREFACPGMHSDVGGGYGPEQQGRYASPKGTPRDRIDGEKLSQIPLNIMHDAALAALVPLKKTQADARFSEAGAETENYHAFAVSPALRSAYDAFIAAMPKQLRPLREFLTDYLAWRYQARRTYTGLGWATRLGAPKPGDTDPYAGDRDDLIGANRVLNMDVEALEARSMVTPSGWSLLSGQAGIDDPRAAAVRRMAAEAPTLFMKIKAMPPVPAALATLFATFVHDSYAGFRPYDQVKLFGIDVIPGSWEPQGYFRYRRRYEGDDRQFTQVLPEEKPAATATRIVAT